MFVNNYKKDTVQKRLSSETKNQALKDKEDIEACDRSNARLRNSSIPKHASSNKCSDAMSSIAIAFNQCQDKNCKVAKKNLDSANDNISDLKDDKKVISNKIKALASLVKKQQVIIDEKDYLTDEIHFVNAKLQKIIHTDRKRKLDVKVMQNQTKK